MADNRIIIAIDGFSSSGKSSMAKQLAKTIGYAYVDSGAMYRAVTLYAMRKGISTPDSLNEKALIDELSNIAISFRVDDATGRSRTVLNGEDVEDQIRTIEVSNQVSPVSAVAEVRRDLVKKQQAFGVEKGIVMDGRDIGTTVFPDAEMKVFVDASPEVRAKRRHLELQQKGQDVAYEDVYKNVCERDHIDSTRQESPLRKADDAYVLDNDNMTIEEQNQWLLDLYNKIVSSKA
ncbi:MAG: (d)CMP kinase [Muribaculaceae bacterium]|jgi:cytidylate kinase|nr:(d)CMP kinase [Muribaculaceae bacterium]MBQ2371112.1 (d)CMP kinase [Muribaculaceae bacterium]MBQ5697766.1 (d)CMP kinase [Muribaculaceae bacterium]MBQ5724060.1 (d)CMP kinase [Muribaculaceae bacterium]MEE1366385.1 (d)CMP kinase [Muribaculaceae bacterium]